MHIRHPLIIFKYYYQSMKSPFVLPIMLCFFLLLGAIHIGAQNPFIINQYTADPSARVFEGRVYVYPSHDIPCGAGQGIIGFCMEDYHVYSSENLTDWKDHGVIVSQQNVLWVDSTSYSMWAPDCIFNNSKYYFYFPAVSNEQSEKRMSRIGVALSDKPYGPFIPELNYIDGIKGIDPNPFIDKNGQAYLYWAGMRKLTMAKLDATLLNLASAPEEITGLPQGFKEGPYLFERKGIYYLTYPFVADSTERLDYAIGTNPMGPFEYKGVIMDESPIACWTNHQSIIEYKGQWYLFYHHNDLSPDFDKNRSIRVDSLFFNSDGSIQKVIPTLRGVGLTEASKQIHLDRYSAISESGASIDFIDTNYKQLGWKTTLTKKGSWVSYNSVDFGRQVRKGMQIRACAEASATIEVRLKKFDGPTLASIEISKNKGFFIMSFPLEKFPAGVQNLYIVLKNSGNIDIDWISFR